MARKPVQYDTLLRIRQLQQDRQAQELAVTRRSIRAAMETREALVEQRQRLLAEASNRAQHRFYAKEVGEYYLYERHLTRLRDEQDAEIRRLRTVEESQRRELEESMKRRRMVEILRDKKIEAFEKEVRKEEQKITDESATNAAARQKNHGEAGENR